MRDRSPGRGDGKVAREKGGLPHGRAGKMPRQAFPHVLSPLPGLWTHRFRLPTAAPWAGFWSPLPRLKSAVCESPSQTGYNPTMAVAAPNTPATSTTERKPRRYRFQFSLRTALLLMFLASILFAGFAWRRNRAERQRKIVAELRDLGAGVEYRYFTLWPKDYAVSPAPNEEFFLCRWLRVCVGDDFVYDVHRVTHYGAAPIPPAAVRPVIELVKKLPRVRNLFLDGDCVRGKDLEEFPFLETMECLSLGSSTVPHGGQLTDDDLIPLERATKLKHLSLRYQPIGDAGLAHLRNCRQLHFLLLLGTNVSDEGLQHLREMPEMESLWLASTRVSDQGLKNLQAMNQLKFLELSNNEIHGPGLADIGPKPHLAYLNLSKTKVDDAALAHLGNFPQLEELLLFGTKVTGTGLSSVRNHKKLTGVGLGGCPVTDASLEGFVVPLHWEVVSLSGTNLTDAGILALQLPPNINSVLLDGTSITDATLDHLQTLPKLTFLDIERTQVTPAGIKRFQTKYPLCELKK